MALARSKRYLAEVVCSFAPVNAWRMMTASLEGGQFSPGAIALIEGCEPLVAWERLEKGSMHYFAALRAHEHGFVAAEPYHLGEAEAAYRQVLIELSDRRHRWRRKFRRLRLRASKGVKLVADAQQGNYDACWLPS